MRPHHFRPIVGLFSGFLCAFVALADPSESIPNWTAPARWKPAPAERAAATAAQPLGQLSTADLSGGLPFVPVTPCRIVDTRRAPGTFGGPQLAAGVPRNFPLPSGPCPGIGAGVSAYSLNITVTNALGSGYIKIYPQGASAPVVSTVNYVAGQTLANAAIVPAGVGGGITVSANNFGAHLIIDINGYYSSILNSGESFQVTADTTAAGALTGVNLSGDGVRGQTSGAGFSGVFGNNTGGGKGVFGSSTSGSGVGGQSTSGPGLRGDSSTGSGVYGRTAGSSGATGAAGVWGDTHDYFGVWGTSVAGDGVHGQTAGSTASGVAGLNASSGFGVFGSSASGEGIFGIGSTGVHGSSIAGWGVYGHSTTGDGLHGDTVGNSASGVAGINTGGGFGVFGGANGGVGVVGNSQGGDGVYGTSVGDGAGAVHAVGTSYCSGHPNIFCSGGAAGLNVEGTANFNNSIYVATDLQVAGYKNFVAPHPTDPSKQIAFVSLEGPEAGTYFRGTARLVGGYAEIPVPESFRLVTAPQGLTVVATPSASAASLFCVSKSLDKIVFQGSADVEFDYVVNGLRAGYQDYEAIQNNVFFVARSASDRNLQRMPDEAVRRLKANGILNDDGSVNEETARKLGWDKRQSWNRAPQVPPSVLHPTSAAN